jgi:hypothetical protein
MWKAIWQRCPLIFTRDKDNFHYCALVFVGLAVRIQLTRQVQRVIKIIFTLCDMESKANEKYEPAKNKVFLLPFVYPCSQSLTEIERMGKF